MPTTPKSAFDSDAPQRSREHASSRGFSPGANMSPSNINHPYNRRDGAEPLGRMGGHLSSHAGKGWTPLALRPDDGDNTFKAKLSLYPLMP
jgi:hypothetical protein